MSLIHKFRGGIAAVGQFIVTKTASIATLNVSSDIAIRDVTVSNNLTGALPWRGVVEITSGEATVTVSNATLAATSGSPIVLTLLNVSSIAMHVNVATIVDNTSFIIAANEAVATGTQEVSYVIIA